MGCPVLFSSPPSVSLLPRLSRYPSRYPSRYVPLPRPDTSLYRVPPCPPTPPCRVPLTSLKLEMTKAKDSTASATARRHAQENFDKAWTEVQETEVRMGVKEPWTDTSPEWAEAAHLVSTKRYRLALLKLERLVVQRMFELTKMNLSQTGKSLSINS